LGAFPVRRNYGRILYHFRAKAKYWSKIAIFSYRSVENTQRRTTAQRRNRAVVCRHSRRAVVRWLIVLIYCPSRGSASVRSAVSASFQIISRLVGRLGSVVRVSVSFQNCALRMSRPSCFCRLVCHSLCQKGHFSVPTVLSCFRGIPQWRRCAVVPLCAVACFPGTLFIPLAFDSPVRAGSP